MLHDTGFKQTVSVTFLVRKERSCCSAVTTLTAKMHVLHPHNELKQSVTST